MAMLKGFWKFKDSATIAAIAEDITQAVNYTTGDGVARTEIKLNAPTTNPPVFLLLGGMVVATHNGETDFRWVGPFANDEEGNRILKVINFGPTEQTVSDEFYALFTQMATEDLTLADKLTRIANNERRVYDAGYAAGKASGDVSEQTDTLIDGSMAGDVTTQAENIRANAFHSCKNILSLSAPRAVSVGATACVGCGSLERVSFPELTSFSVQTFYGCKTLKHVYAPVAKSLSTATFQGCGMEIVALEGLEQGSTNGFRNTPVRIARFPSLLSAGTSTFDGCAALQAVIVGTTTCKLPNVNAFAGTPIESGTGYIYVPDEAVETYKAATNWNAYASQIKGLSEIPQSILEELEAYRYGD